MNKEIVNTIKKLFDEYSYEVDVGDSVYRMIRGKDSFILKSTDSSWETLHLYRYKAKTKVNNWRDKSFYLLNEGISKQMFNFNMPSDYPESNLINVFKWILQNK